MEKDTYELTVAALLSGIGKLVSRSGTDTKNYNKAAIDFLRKINLADNKTVNESLLEVLSSDDLERTDEKRLLKVAEKVARSLNKDKESQKDLPLTSIFYRLNRKNSDKTREKLVIPEKIKDVPVMPVENTNLRLSPEYYQELLDELEEFLQEISFNEDYINSIINKFEDLTSALPSLPGSDFMQDISLFDYLKITAAIASCLNEYFKVFPEKKDLLEDETKLFEENLLLLFSADFSGIQNFIYTVATAHALKSLRSRSFFLEFLMDHYIDELLQATGLSRVNLLYSGGGHCYLLLPNTQKVKQALDTWTDQFNQWLRNNYDIHLFLADGYSPCSINDLLNLPVAEEGIKGSYKQMFERVSSAIAEKKLQRYTADEVRALNNSKIFGQGRECRICGHSGKLIHSDENGDICENCKMFEDISNKVIDDTVYVVSEDKQFKNDFLLPGYERPVYVSILSSNSVPTRIKQDNQIKRIYSKNRYEQDYYLNTKLNIGDYIYIDDNGKAQKEMNDYSSQAKGIDRIGVLRMDVDDLGSAFIGGFEQEGATTQEREKYISLVRTSAFSRASSNFFKSYINSILNGTLEGIDPLKVVIIYSGGDDVFLVGSWNDIIRASLRIQRALKEFTGEALTISAGVGLFNSTFPIRTASYETGKLEEMAKDYRPADMSLEELPRKNAISLFEVPKIDPWFNDKENLELSYKIKNRNTFDWDQFSLNVQEDKLYKIREFLKVNSEKGNTMLYNLYSLLRDFEQKPINLARYAYVLAKVEPPFDQKKDKEKSYRAFTENMYDWAINERKELLMAIQLYIYEVRENERQ